MRMSYTCKRAVPLLAITTFIIYVAFLSSLSSSLMPLRAFGIYTGTLIMINFILIAMVMPAALAFHEERWYKYRFCLCYCGEKGLKLKNESEAIVDMLESLESSDDEDATMDKTMDSSIK